MASFPVWYRKIRKSIKFPYESVQIVSLEPRIILDGVIGASDVEAEPVGGVIVAGESPRKDVGRLLKVAARALPKHLDQKSLDQSALLLQFDTLLGAPSHASVPCPCSRS